jgi:hypothetical protein
LLALVSSNNEDNEESPSLAGGDNHISQPRKFGEGKLVLFLGTLPFDSLKLGLGSQVLWIVVYLEKLNSLIDLPTDNKRERILN